MRLDAEIIEMTITTTDNLGEGREINMQAIKDTAHATKRTALTGQSIRKGKQVATMTMCRSHTATESLTRLWSTLSNGFHMPVVNRGFRRLACTSVCPRQRSRVEGSGNPRPMCPPNRLLTVTLR